MVRSAFFAIHRWIGDDEPGTARNRSVRAPTFGFNQPQMNRMDAEKSDEETDSGDD
jgi:hypothetical protein